MSSFRRTSWVLMLLIAASAVSEAQPASGKSFEVASVKPVAGPSDIWIQPRTYPERIVWSGAPLVWIIEYAYGFSASRREGDIPFKFYNIEATIPPGTTTSDIRDMMKTLLVERFAFKFRIQQREMNALRLVIAEEGHRLTSVAAPPADFKVEGRPLAAGRVLDTFFPGAAHFVGAGVTFDQIAEGLSDVLKQPVLNRTGLEGRFNIDVKHRPEEITDQDTDVPSDYPFLREALEDHGLRLVEGRDQVQIMVIDRLGEPSSN